MSVPRTWVLLGQKAGDNNQLLALAGALGWPYEVRRLAFRRTELLTNLALRVTLLGMRRSDSDALEAPWPDLILTAGRRNEPVARWIRRRSGGRSRIVHLGRPWTHPRLFDLVVTTPQYQVPPLENVLQISLPFVRVDEQRRRVSREIQERRLAALPRPWTAMLLGGDSGLTTFDEEEIGALVDLVQADVTRSGGSLLVTTSARTPLWVPPLLESRITVPSRIHVWRPADPDNPYPGWLALADDFVVTGESVSMLAEAVATGRPVRIYDPERFHSKVFPGRRPRPWWLCGRNWRWKPLSTRFGTWVGPRRMSRDVRRIQDALVAAGCAAFLGERSARSAASVPSRGDDLDRAVARVRRLFPAAAGD